MAQLSRSPLTLRYQARTDALRTQMTAEAVRRWNALPDWSEPDRFAVPMAARSTQAQTMLVRTLASYVSLAADVKVTVDVANHVGDALYPDEEDGITGAWRIPTYWVWKQLGDALMSQDELVAAAQDRVTTSALTDLAFSQASAMKDIAENTQGITGFVRVASGSSSCDFCNEADGEHYSSGDDFPLHPGCVCSVEPSTS